jgi:hypothetical protein
MTKDGGQRAGIVRALLMVPVWLLVWLLEWGLTAFLRDEDLL